MTWLLIAAGGAAGAAARFAVSEWLGASPRDGLPLGTLVVNVVGAALLGLLLTWFDQAPAGREGARLLLAVGFLGSFTTFSAFSIEIVRLSEAGGWLRGGGYALLSVGLGVVGVLAGIAAGLWLRRGG